MKELRVKGIYIFKGFVATNFPSPDLSIKQDLARPWIKGSKRIYPFYMNSA